MGVSEIAGLAERDGELVGAIERMRTDFRLHAETFLRILTKAGDTVPLRFNRAQLYVHKRIEEQLRQIGRVRALILKGRQQGISTYIAARYYHRVSMNHGRKAFIVAHEQKATDNLFKMVKRYHEYNPLCPSTSATNAKELVFDKLDSGYLLATAGSKDVGRSNTAQLLHGSEFAFWDNAASHLAGLGNTIGDLPGSEIILESTGNGVGNQFHMMWQDAEQGRNEYAPIFVPWFWQPEYRVLTLPRDFELSDDELGYAQAYGCDLTQMAWRRNKIATYGRGQEWLFDQEYPAVPSLAFQTSTRNPIILPSDVSRAMNNDYSERYGALVIGCDPAEEGDDRTAIVFRHGRVVFRVESHEKKGPMEVAGMLVERFNKYRPDAIFIDRIGIGAGILDRLKELNIPGVIGVNSATEPQDKTLYANKRAEMWYRMKAWVEDFPVRMPNNLALASDLSGPQPKTNSHGLRLVESKKEMKKRQIRSPDLADALAMTFAELVQPRAAAPEKMVVSVRKPATKAGY